MVSRSRPRPEGDTSQISPPGDPQERLALRQLGDLGHRFLVLAAEQLEAFGAQVVAADGRAAVRPLDDQQEAVVVGGEAGHLDETAEGRGSKVSTLPSRGTPPPIFSSPTSTTHLPHGAGALSWRWLQARRPPSCEKTGSPIGAPLRAGAGQAARPSGRRSRWPTSSLCRARAGPASWRSSMPSRAALFRPRFGRRPPAAGRAAARWAPSG